MKPFIFLMREDLKSLTLDYKKGIIAQEAQNSFYNAREIL